LSGYHFDYSLFKEIVDYRIHRSSLNVVPRDRDTITWKITGRVPDKIETRFSPTHFKFSQRTNGLNFKDGKSSCDIVGVAIKFRFLSVFCYLF
jgi:hypothetical protein